MSSTTSAPRSRFLSAASILLALIGFLLLVSCLVYPPAYVYRVIWWNLADANDHRRFPAQELETSPSDFTFRRSLDEARVASLFEAQPEVDRLDEFLASQQTEVAGDPGSAFLYNNYHPLLLGLILERATGVPVAEYLQERIWKPLGMEYPGSWSLDSTDTGFPKMESGINARAIDFARFGRLYLKGGAWEGNQIVPDAWVADSTRVYPAPDRGSYYPDEFDLPSAKLGYGYMWWRICRGEGDCDFAAEGNLGQLIYVSPRSNLIIAKNASDYGDLSWHQWDDLMSRVAASFAMQ